MNFEIIDFHTHPFLEAKENICRHKELFEMNPDKTVNTFTKLGASKICGSVIRRVNADKDETVWECLCDCNKTALTLKEKYGSFYIPGFHVHPDYVEESINEIRTMSARGIKLIGELVPYMHGWSGYVSDGFSQILYEAQKHKMIVNLHSSSNDDEMDELVKKHKDVTFVMAHPGEYDQLMRHIDRMKKNENCFLDLSGTGIFRHGAVRRLIDSVGCDRILFGSDFPTCNPGMFVGAILFDELLLDAEKEKIFSLNAKRLLGL